MLRCVVWAELRMALLPPRGAPAVCQFSHAPQRSLRESYRLLQLPDPPYSQAQVKEAYLRMAKLYHPDSGTPTANSALFSQIQEAYRTVLAHLSRQGAEAQLEAEDEEECEPKGQAPQHRQYLSYEGVGSGTPSQRERVYRQHRVDRAAQQVLEYRQREQERAAARDEGAVSDRQAHKRSRHAKITQAVERLVEDLILESMARGDFQNLSGAGKPLAKFNHNPYADPMTHNLNRILIDNGYQPQWIVVQKEIREAVERLRAGLLQCRAGFGDPMTPAEQDRWEEHCQAAGDHLTRLNKKVDDFNLIVPLLSKQMVHFSLQRELDRALQTDRERRQERERERERERRKREEMTASGRGIFSWVQNLLK
ncbi:dnaJ homolog subfamily C member 28 isoform X2 [Anguilla rostrata]